MQTTLRIIERAVGWNHGLFLTIENIPYMALTIEVLEEGRPVYRLSLSPTTANRMATSCATRRCVSSFVTANSIPTTTGAIPQA